MYIYIYDEKELLANTHAQAKSLLLCHKLPC